MLGAVWLRNLAKRWGRRRSGAKSDLPAIQHARLRLVRLEDRRVLNAAPLAVLAGSELTVQAGAADGHADVFHLFQTQDHGAAQLHVEVNGAEVFAGDAEHVSKVNVHGSADDDTLLVDFKGGNPLPHDGLSFDAAGQVAGDQLQLAGGSVAAVHHSLTADASGAAQIISADGQSTITFTRVENLLDTLHADAREITIAADAEHATLSNGATDGTHQLTTDLGTSDTFSTPTNSLAIRLGHDSDAMASTGTLTIDGSISIPGGLMTFNAGPHGTLLVNGQIDASDPHPGAVGGTVELLGERVGVFDGASVNVSGDAGGGTILLGGDLHGANPAIHNAEFSYVAPEARLLADATSFGHGGQIVVWADDSTRVFGELSAHGGADGGSGGFVETSGRHGLDVTQAPLLSSIDGHGGTWLLDPNNLTLGFGTDKNVTATNPFTTTDDNAFLSLGTLRNAMTGGANVIVQTASAGSNTQAGDITLAAPFDFAGSGTNTLSFIAHNNIFINGVVFASTAGSTLNLSLKADSDGSGAGDVVINQAINLGNGNFSSAGVGFQGNAQVTSQAGTIAIDHKGNVDIRALISTTGDVRIATTAGSINMPPAAGLVQGHDVLLQAANGIGTPTDRMKVQVFNNLAAQVTSASATGGIFITEIAGGGDLHVGEVNDATGNPVKGISTTNNQPIDVQAESGALFIDRPVVANGTAPVTLHANNALGTANADVNLGDDVSGDLVTIAADDEINYLAGSIKATNLLLQGFNGVGHNPDKVQTNVSGQVAAQLLNATATGGIFLRETAAGGDLSIGTVQGVAGISTPNNRPIELRTTNGSIVIAADIATNGSGPGNVTLIAETTGADNAILPGGGRVSTAGSGTLDLQGSHIGSGSTKPVLINIGTGNLTLTSTGLNANGDISVSNNSATGLNLSQIKAVNTDPSEQTVSIIQSMGNLNVDARLGNAADNLRLQVDAGSITGVAGSTLVAKNLLLDAANGIGPVDVSVAGVLAARLTSPNANADIILTDTASPQDLTIGTFGGVTGISTTNDRSIFVLTDDGSILLGADVTASGTGSVFLHANSTGAANDVLEAGGRISTGSGNIFMNARGIGTGAGGPVLTNVNAGAFALISNGVANAGDVAISNNSAGGLNTTQIANLITDADSQRVTIAQTAGNLTIGNAIGNVTDDLVLQAPAGSIFGGGTVTANNLLLDSNQGVGGAGQIQTQVSGALAARVTAVASGGGISIEQLAAAGNLTVGTFAGVTGVSVANGQNVTLQTDGGRLTINSAVGVNGAGTLLLKASGAGSDIAVNAPALTSQGPVRLQAQENITFGASGDVSSTSGDVELSADVDNNGTGAVTMGDPNRVDAGSGHILVQAAGNITLGGLLTTNPDCSTASSAVRIESRAGGVIDGGDTLIDVDAPNGQLQILAQTGIGSSGPFGALETRVACLDVETQTSGNVAIVESDSVKLFRGNNVGPGDVLIRANGTMLVDNSPGAVAAVSTNSGSVTLEARGGTSDLVLHSEVISTSGQIALTADRDVRFGPGGDVTSLNGNVVVTADADNGGTDSGAAIMDPDTRINAGTGTITITADGDILVTGLRTLSTLDTAVNLMSREKAIVDGGDTATDIDASQGCVVMTAATGIGSGNPLEIIARCVDATNNSSGNVELAAGTALAINRIQQFGPGTVSVVSGGTLTVNFFSTTLPTIGATSGNIFLNASAPGADLIVNGGLATTTGNITGQALHDVQLGAAAVINSTSGNVTFTAGADPGTSTGQLTMDPNSQINAGNGQILLIADQDLRITGLRTAFASPPDAVTLTSPNGKVFDAGDASTDVTAPNGCLNVTGPGGTDTANPLELNVACATGVTASSTGGGTTTTLSTGGTATDRTTPRGDTPGIFFFPGSSGTPSPGGNLIPFGGPIPPPPHATSDGNPPPGMLPGQPRPGDPPPDRTDHFGRGGRRDPLLPTDFLINISRILSPDDRDTVLPDPVRLDAVPITEQEVILRPLDGTGHEIRSIHLPDDVLDNLPGLFKKLDRGRFRIYFREAGEERVMLIREVKLLDGRPVDDTDVGLDKPPTPAAGSQPKK